MKRLYLALVTFVLFATILAPVAWAGDSASPTSATANDTRVTPTATATTRLLDFSGWVEITRPITQLRRTATPTPRYNKVIFPLPTDAEVIPIWDTKQTTIYYTYLSMDEVMDFYRAELAPDGAIERPLLTVLDGDTEAWFSMVFDGWKHAPGRSVVVQGVQMSPYQYVVTIRLEKV
jgi:hypothetical protein